MKNRRSLVIALTLIIAAGSALADKLRFLLAARDLPNMDIFNGAPDPYAIVYYASNSTEGFSKFYETDYISNENNPNWPDVLGFNLVGKFSQQRIKIDIYDWDYNADDLIGSAEFRLRDLSESLRCPLFLFRFFRPVYLCFTLVP